MQFFFRTDANADIGYGHVMRCLTLANQLQTLGAQCYFICQSADAFPQHLFLGDVKLCLIDAPSLNKDAELSAEILSKKQFNSALDWLILDNYQLGDEWVLLLPKVDNLLVIDDLARFHQTASILLDQSLGRTKQNYIDKVPANCQLLVGESYTLLRPEFLQLRSQAEAKRKSFEANHLLISVGATDHLNISQILLSSLKYLSQEYYPNVSVVLSSKAKHLSSIKRWVSDYQEKQQRRQIKLLTDVSDMAKLMLSADLAIGASGSSAWERAAMGLPTLNIITADNQKFIARAMNKMGLTKALKLFDDKHKIAQQIMQISQQKHAQFLSQSGFNTIDANGCQRVIKTMLRSRASELSLRPFEPTDKVTIYHWQLQPNIRQYARTPSVPSIQEHSHWFEQQLLQQELAEPEHINLIIMFNQLSCGMIRLSKLEMDWEVSILISQPFHGLKVAQAALRQLQKAYPVNMRAEIAPENIASVKAFLNSGFMQTGKRSYFYQALA
ncbi:UDP-2,4-diacetamido-2,4,6-trideoxy-beta-L-altropyranose hydrolase [Motilimonas pumila]|uniref:UDP-2,4-diacetamido-2,4, 6-trideoxy-beta-L-altropyranose hydrolase n=1 Tax=Motilimonas pumila TaxID=2303987 RepID=A0A418YGM8_9GAMM|nr:UDP-2,4-diacetamido-2,4,6-trideoxy-beta-L-altropyranose hydrolase [Motilimonas pumila]RJG49015.1 UDP-2,4-diacetamido-2,4,6-trideoxy-beta-L-altropyranose hydrolase [Motilimonas pumila]